MPEQITLSVNGRSVTVPQGATVAVAVAMAEAHCRNSVNGGPRTVLCGMGICFECRVQINSSLHQRSCQMLCSPGMQVRTDG